MFALSVVWGKTITHRFPFKIERALLVKDKPKVYDEHLRDDLLQGQAIDLISVMGPGFISM